MMIKEDKVGTNDKERCYGRRKSNNRNEHIETVQGQFITLDLWVNSGLNLLPQLGEE